MRKFVTAQVAEIKHLIAEPKTEQLGYCVPSTTTTTTTTSSVPSVLQFQQQQYSPPQQQYQQFQQPGGHGQHPNVSYPPPPIHQGYSASAFQVVKPEPAPFPPRQNSVSTTVQNQQYGQAPLCQPSPPAAGHTVPQQQQYFPPPGAPQTYSPVPSSGPQWSNGSTPVSPPMSPQPGYHGQTYQTPMSPPPQYTPISNSGTPTGYAGNAYSPSLQQGMVSSTPNGHPGHPGHPHPPPLQHHTLMSSPPPQQQANPYSPPPSASSSSSHQQQYFESPLQHQHGFSNGGTQSQMQSRPPLHHAPTCPIPASATTAVAHPTAVELPAPNHTQYQPHTSLRHAQSEPHFAHPHSYEENGGTGAASGSGMGWSRHATAQHQQQGQSCPMPDIAELPCEPLRGPPSRWVKPGAVVFEKMDDSPKLQHAVPISRGE
ncbi:hypothetical protein K402DRAFT_165946 [Aulographum hederae CBS 113979]|uniref:Uncharacterized protein n=1 Tax=Aulographum hederae CBS 113979 TaxID=1176131 RepID=A0A6G1GRG8_9PEZI|nr:hypothetical protein K402DRAFT_165946 [Aulographum hederae CBS 113979]